MLLKNMLINYDQLMSFDNFMYDVIKEENIDSLKQFIEQNQLCVNLVDHKLNTPLHYACKMIKPNFEIIKLLIENGANINAVNKNNYSILHSLFHCHQLYRGQNEIDYNIIKYILHQNILNNIIQYILHQSILPETLNTFNIKDQNILIHECRQYNSNNEIIKLLLEKGINVNCKDKDGNTPIIIACDKGWALEMCYADTVKILLDKNANINEKNNEGYNALYYAIFNFNAKTLKLLLDHKVDLNNCDNKNNTALMVACLHNRYNAAEILLEYCTMADINYENYGNDRDDGHTSLTIACRNGSKQLAFLLLKKGADVNYKCKENISAMHYACFYGHHIMVDILLDHGADANSKSKWNVTPLMTACARGHKEVVELLLRVDNIGVNIYDTDDRNKTAYDYAKENGHIDIMNLFSNYGSFKKFKMYSKRIGHNIINKILN